MKPLSTITAMIFVSSTIVHYHVCRRAYAFCPGAQQLPRSLYRFANHHLNKNSAVVLISSRLIRTSPKTVIHPTVITRLNDGVDDAAANDKKEIEPTWTYVPYQSAPKTRSQRANINSSSSINSFRRLSTSTSWTVPEQITIPENELQISFARASGAGGQNVNKVNTKVEIRFHLDTADWIPLEVRERLKENESNRINNEGYMVITSQEYRTQIQNRKDAVEKLEDILRSSWPRPKVRKMRKGLTKEAKENRRELKKKISEKKESRRRVEF